MCWDYGHELSHPEATEVLYVQSNTMTHGYEWTSHPIFLEESYSQAEQLRFPGVSGGMDGRGVYKPGGWHSFSTVVGLELKD